jgi:hypothetical protein
MVVLLIVPVVVALFAAGVAVVLEACTTVIGAVTASVLGPLPAGLLAAGELPGFEAAVWGSGTELALSPAPSVGELLVWARDIRAVASNTIPPQTSL